MLVSEIFLTAFNLSTVILTRIEARPGTLQSTISKRRVLFGLKSQGGQTGVARVPVDTVGRGGRAVGTGRRRHRRIDGRAPDAVKVADIVEARGGHAWHS